MVAKSVFLQYDLVTGLMKQTDFATAAAETGAHPRSIKNCLWKSGPFLVKKRYQYGRTVEELHARRKAVTWENLRISIYYHTSGKRYTFPTPQQFKDHFKAMPEVGLMWARLVIWLVSNLPEHKVTLPDLGGVTIHINTLDYVDQVQVSDTADASSNWMCFKDGKLLYDGSFGPLMVLLYERAVELQELDGFIRSLNPVRLDVYKDYRFKFLDMWFSRDDASTKVGLTNLPFDAGEFELVLPEGPSHTALSENDAIRRAEQGKGTYYKKLKPLFTLKSMHQRNHRIGLVRDGVVTKAFPDMREFSKYMGLSYTHCCRSIKTGHMKSGERAYIERFGITIEKL